MSSEHTLSRGEREAILTWADDESEIHVTAEIPAFRRLLERRGWVADPDGFFRIPVKALSIRSKVSLQDRVLSPKQRAAVDKLRAMGQARPIVPPGSD